MMQVWNLAGNPFQSTGTDLRAAHLRRPAAAGLTTRVLRLKHLKAEARKLGCSTGTAASSPASGSAAALLTAWREPLEAFRRQALKLVRFPGSTDEDIKPPLRNIRLASAENAAVKAVQPAQQPERSPSESAWDAAWAAMESCAPAASTQTSERQRRPPWRMQAAVLQPAMPPVSLNSAAIQQNRLMAGSRPLEVSQLSIQGIDPKARSQLLAISLSALEQQIAALPDAATFASPEDWTRIITALLASCSLAAARSWLGYVPTELQQQAAAAIAQINAGLVAPQQNFSTLPSAGFWTASPGKSSSRDESKQPPSAGTSLWARSKQRCLLHAGVVRFLRFGPAHDPPPPQASYLEEVLPVLMVSRRLSAGGLKPIEASTTVTAASVPASATEQTEHTEHTAESDGHLSLRDAARRRLVDTASGVKGWRHQNLAQAWQGSAAAAGPSVIHDMAVAVADAVASVYLAEARSGVVSGPSNPDLKIIEGCWPIFLKQHLSSSRALERFRNEVAFHRWTRSQVEDIIAVYEDRHDVIVMASGGALLTKSVPFKRTKELDALGGPRATMCLLLEAFDVAAPLFRTFARKLGNAISWLLTALIGRSLGLIFRGMRQSFRWPHSDQTNRKKKGATANGHKVSDGYLWTPLFDLT